MSSAAANKVSVVIPVLNAEPYLDRLLTAILSQQPRPPDEVVLMDSMSKDRTREIAARFPNVRVVPVPKFSHGGTRNEGARAARGEIVVLMTQDAVPRDKHWLAKLLEPFSDPKVAATYSRQVPYPDANPMERYFLFTHFPPGNSVRREQGQSDLGFLNVFFSNVAAALRRDLIKAGYAVIYQPDSVVIHSHNYTLDVCFRRYFDSVYSLTQIFPKHDIGESASMGFTYLFREIWHMLRHHPAWFPFYICYTTCKVAGTLMGHFAEKLPRTWARKMSLHRYYWERPAGSRP